MNITTNKLKFLNLIIDQCSLRTFTNVLKTFPKAGCILNTELTNDNHTVFSYIIPSSLCINNYESNQFTASGALAVLDELSTYSLMLKDKNSRSGVSVHFNVNIHNICKANDSVIVISTADKIGKTLGFCSMKIYSNDTEGKLLVSGNHIKYLPGGGKLFDFLTSNNILPLTLKLIELVGSDFLDHIFTKKLLNQKSENINIREAFDNLNIAISDSKKDCKMNNNRINNNILGITHGGAVAMAIEQSAIMFKNIDNYNTKKENLEFISSLDINYLSPAKGNLLFTKIDENSGEVIQEKTGLICCQYKLNWRNMNKL